jgi:Abortive infection alpha
VSEAYDLAKAGFDAAMAPFAELLQKIGGPAAEEIGLTLQDHVRVFRLKRQIRLLQKTKAILDRAGIEPGRVPLKLLGTIVDNATLEEDDSLQDMWAALLANNAVGIGHEVMFPEILRQLSPADARLLRNCFKEVMTSSLDRPGGFFSVINSVEEWSTSQRMQHLKRIEPVSPLSLENLTRLGLIAMSEIRINGQGTAVLTNIGYAFIRTCEDPAVVAALEEELYKDPRVRRPQAQGTAR